MSVTAMSRTFWTEFPPLSYTDKNGKQVAIKSTTAKIVLLAIADNADDFGENSYQSFETLANKSSLDRRSVIRVVRALIGNGFLVVAGVSAYGTNNYTVALDKLGEPPKKRTKAGRPKSSDSESLVEETGDPEAKSGDFGAKTSDPEAETGDLTSPDPSFNPPSSVHDSDDEEIQARAEILRVFYESTIGPITTMVMDNLENAAKEYPDVTWYRPAFEVMVEHANHRSWAYTEKVLQGWKEHYFGWKPGDDKRPGKKTTAAQSGDRSKYLRGEYADYIQH